VKEISIMYILFVLLANYQVWSVCGHPSPFALPWGVSCSFHSKCYICSKSMGQTGSYRKIV